MTGDQLKAFLERRLFVDAHPAISAFAYRIHQGPFDGVGFNRPLKDTCPDTRLLAKHGWIVTADDRTPKASGPDGFDPADIKLLLRIASLLAIDSAEPGADIYSYFMDEVTNGNRFLVVQTTEERHRLWREFLRVKWQGNEICEIVPVKADPTRILRAFVTHFDRDR